jgi:hypothetical protein
MIMGANLKLNRIKLIRVESDDDICTYKVDLYDDTGKFLPMVFHGFKTRLVVAMTDWCMDVLDMDDWTFMMNGPEQVYDFEFGSEEVALAFKMRWDGTIFDDAYEWAA